MNTNCRGSDFTFWIYMYIGCVLLCHTCLGNLRCLSCRDVARPRYCEYLQTCGDHEECYVDSYATVSGTVRYNLGCRDRKMCALTNINPRTTVLSLRTTQIPICNECCEGDLCNQAGCGEQGYPNNFGQICFNCHQQLHPTDCDKIMLCGENEICKISTREIAGDMVYVTGCEQSLVCSRDYYQIVGRRDNSCAQCCNSTLCNNACESRQVKCENRLPNCYEYGNEMCRQNHPFYDWAKENCVEKCGLCHLHYPGSVQVYKQQNGFRATEKSGFHIVKLLHNETITSWAIFSADGIVVLIFFTDDTDNADTVNKEGCLNILRKNFIPMPKEKGINVEDMCTVICIRF